MRRPLLLALFFFAACFHRFYQDYVGVAADASDGAISSDAPVSGCQTANCGGKTPFCEPDTHQCVGCRDGKDCSETRGCSQESHTCTDCTFHSECASSFCKLDGSCAATNELLIVDNGVSCQSIGNPIGNLPYCEIADALPHVDLNHVRLLVNGSDRAYRAVSLPIGMPELFIVGAAPGHLPVIAGLSIGQAIISTSVSVDNVEIAASSGSGFDCTADGGSKPIALQLSRVRIHDCAGWAVHSVGCDLNLDAGLIGPHNRQGGLSLSHTSFQISNSVIFMNDGPPLIADQNRSSGEVGFSTLIANSGAVSCKSGSPFSINHSIVLQNGASQFDGALTLSQVVVGKDDNSAIAGAVKSTPVFAGDYYQLAKGDPANAGDNGCCVDKATAGPPYDALGNKRPRGRSYDIGAHEVQ